MGGGDGVWVRYVLEEYGEERREIQGGRGCVGYGMCHARCRERPRVVWSGARDSTDPGRSETYMIWHREWDSSSGVSSPGVGCNPPKVATRVRVPADADMTIYIRIFRLGV